MEDKDRELFHQVMCAMLPFGIKGQVDIEASTGQHDIYSGALEFTEVPVDVELLGINTDGWDIEVYPLGNIDLTDYYYTLDDFTPYLRRIEYMTDKENEIYRSIENKGPQDFLNYGKKKLDYLYSIGIDAFGLIDKGYAKERK